MPEWRSMFVHRAQFLAILQAPLTQTDTPITIVPIFSEYPDGTGDWGSSSTILVCGDTAKAKLEDFMTRIRQVFGQDCNIAFRASK